MPVPLFVRQNLAGLFSGRRLLGRRSVLALVDSHEQAGINCAIELYADFMEEPFDMSAVDDFARDFHDPLGLRPKP